MQRANRTQVLAKSFAKKVNQARKNTDAHSLFYRGMVLSREDLEKLIQSGVPNSHGFKGTYFIKDVETAAMYSFGTYGVVDRSDAASYAHVLIEVEGRVAGNAGEAIFPNREDGVAVNVSEIRNVYLFEPGFWGGSLYSVPISKPKPKN